MKWDPWQLEFLKTPGDKIQYCGRQVGKSVICAKDAGDWAVQNGSKVVLMIAPTERQAYALFEKTLNYILANYKGMVCKGKQKPTQKRITLTNKTVIWCLPTGLSGTGIRFLTVHRLYGEEASRIPQDVWDAVIPMMLTTGGAKILLTTPAGRGTYASDVWHNKNGAFESYKRFSISSETVANEREISESWTELQKQDMLILLAQEKIRMSKARYAQEYLGQEMDELKQFIPTELIRKCMVIGQSFFTSSPSGDNFLGADIAGQGKDQTVLFSVCRIKDKIRQIGMKVSMKQQTTQTTKDIIYLDEKWHYKRIFIDDGGLGFGVFSELLDNPRTKNKTEALNNSSRSVDSHDKKKKKILKNDLYHNLLSMMEQGRVELEDDDEIFRSLSCLQAEWKDGKEFIDGDYTHIAEALIRAAWCLHDKHLNIYCFY